VIWVLLCAYNEARVIQPTVRAMRAASGAGDTRVILVDDGSADGTAELAESAAAEAGVALTVVRHAQNGGLGAALRTGIGWVLEHAQESDVLVTLDADNTHPPASIPGMVDRVRHGDDLVIASRYQPGARVRGVPGYRRVLSDGGRVLFQLTFPIRNVRDYTCCFRAYSVAKLREAVLVYGDELCTARGFEAVLDLLLRLRQVGIRASEVPLDLDYAERVGQSKMNVARTIRKTLALLARRFVERFTIYSPSRVRARLAAASAAGVRATPTTPGP
jgi:dolichol-phosphate mannosyltransferase